MTDPSLKVGIVIVTYNHADLTLECLASLEQITYSNYQIILVDNNSVDDTLTLVRAHAPGAIVIENERNLGFAEGNNRGIREALHRGCEYVLLLNNDTVVEPSFLQELIDVCEQDPSTGMAGPKILSMEHENDVWFSGGTFDWQSGLVTRLESDVPGTELVARPSDYVVGTALCVRRQVIERIGLLDPRFFLYFEEVDWCLRAHAVGYKLVYVPRAVIRHHVSASAGLNSPLTTYYMTRNSFLFLSKNLHGYQRYRALAAAALREVRALVAFTLKPRYKAFKRDRDARWFGLRDAVRGRWGEMGTEVAAIVSQ